MLEPSGNRPAVLNIGLKFARQLRQVKNSAAARLVGAGKRDGGRVKIFAAGHPRVVRYIEPTRDGGTKHHTVEKCEAVAEISRVGGTMRVHVGLIVGNGHQIEAAVEAGMPPKGMKFMAGGATAVMVSSGASDGFARGEGMFSAESIGSAGAGTDALGVRENRQEAQPSAAQSLECAT